MNRKAGFKCLSCCSLRCSLRLGSTTKLYTDIEVPSNPKCSLHVLHPRFLGPRGHLTFQSSDAALLVGVVPGTFQLSDTAVLLGVVPGTFPVRFQSSDPPLLVGVAPGGTKTCVFTQSLTKFTCQLSNPTSPLVTDVPGSTKHSIFAKTVQAVPNPGFM